MPSVRNPVTAVPAAPAPHAAAHFDALLSLETDCADVAFALQRDLGGFLLVDVRSPEAYRRGHIAGAVNLPHGRINERSLATMPQADLYVVYCAGPHCNGADKAASKLAAISRPVKKMIGGVTGWLDEGLPLVR